MALDWSQIGVAYLVVFLAACLYEAALRTRIGRQARQHLTWVTVVIGTALALAGLLICLPWEAVLTALGGFAAAGAPIVLGRLDEMLKLIERVRPSRLLDE